MRMRALNRCDLCAFIACLCLALPLTAQQDAGKAGAAAASNSLATLAGPLPKTLSAGGGPYLVIADLEVPADKVVTVEPGTVFLFKNFTGMHVQGRLIAEGTAARPIVFTSENDRNNNPSSTLYPNPYDWNGVYIHDNAIGTSMSNCKVFFSVYGIVSDTKFIRVVSTSFASNGKSNLVIAGQEHTVTEAPYSYELSLKDATVNGVPVKILRDPEAPKRNSFRYGGIGVFVAGTALGIYNTVEWHRGQEKLSSLSATSPDNLITHTSSDWNSAQSQRNIGRALTYVGYVIGLAGGAGFGWSFTF
jgi:hypothetical protein